MSMFTAHTGMTADRTAAYGGLADAVGGIATIVLAVAGLANAGQETMPSIAAIVFGAALLIEGGAMLSEYALIAFPDGAPAMSARHSGVSSLSVIFLAGAAGIVLGILGLLGIRTNTLVAAAIITYGTALVVSSNAVWRLHLLKRSSLAAGPAPSQSGSEILANELAFESSGLQALAGLAAVVLGVLAIAGGGDAAILSLVALLALGGALILTGTTLSATVLRFMRPEGGEFAARQPIVKAGE